MIDGDHILVRIIETDDESDLVQGIRSEIRKISGVVVLSSVRSDLPRPSAIEIVALTPEWTKRNPEFVEQFRRNSPADSYTIFVYDDDNKELPRAAWDQLKVDQRPAFNILPISHLGDYLNGFGGVPSVSWPIRIPETFSILFDPEVTPEQLKMTLTAFSNYFRACGGVGLSIDFQNEEAIVLENVDV